MHVSYALYISIYSLIALASFSISLLVYMRKRTAINGYFSAFAVTIAVWQLLGLAAQATYRSPFLATLLLQLSVTVSCIMAVCMLAFALQYTGRRVPLKRLLLAAVLLGIGLTFSKAIRTAEFGPMLLQLNMLDGFYAAALVFAGSCSIGSLYAIGLRWHSLQEKRLRRQASILLFSIGQATLLILLTSVFTVGVPSHLILLLSCFGAVAGIAYAIAFHGLFDIRFVVVRGVLYIATLTAIAAFLIAPAVYITASLFRLQFSAAEFVGLVVSGLVTLIAAQYAKRYFDKLTNAVFYRYYYDPQDVLDQLNATLTRTSTMQSLLLSAQTIIVSAVKPTRLIFLHERTAHGDDRSLVRALAVHNKSAVDVDYLPAGNKLCSLLRARGIALVIRLETVHENQGFMLLGHKKSGEDYMMRDIRMLRVAAGELAIGVQNALRFEEIQRFNETLQRKVEDATAKLRTTNRQLKRLNDSKDDFIGMASHQLRTPLTAVKGYVSLVMEGDAGRINATQRQLLQQAFSSSQKMVYLIADLLNVSRLKTGKFVIERTPTDLAQLVADEVAQLQEEAASRSLELTYDRPAGFPLLPLDETKTRQVIMNFLDNALYYTPAGGHVRAELIRTDKSMEFRVIDDGIGVPKAERHQLFQKFYRAKNAQRTRPDGTGLGLYMASKVVTAQGGAIIFSSQEGRGSSFGFRFLIDMPDGQVPLPPGARA